MGTSGGGGGCLLGGNKCSGLLDAKLTFELLGYTVNLTVALAHVEQLGVVNRAERVGEVSTATEELVLGDRLVVGRLVDDGCLVNDDVGGDGRLNTVVLVRVLLNDGLDDVVDVVVDVLLDTLTLVDDLAMDGCLSILVPVLTSNRGEQSGVLIGRGMSLMHLGHGMNLRVNLLSRVFRIENRLSVVLDVVNVALVLLLTKNLLNLMALVSAVRDRGKVLNILVDLTLAHVEVLVESDVVAVLVRDGTVLGVNVGRSAKTVLDLVSDLATSGAVVVVSGRGGTNTSSSGTNGAVLLVASPGRARVGVGGGRRRMTALIRRVVTRIGSTRKNLLNSVHCCEAFLVYWGLVGQCAYWYERA